MPPEHEQDGRVGPPLPEEVRKETSFKVLSGRSRPADAFAAVRYHDYWFWIDDKDFASKRAMSFMLVLTALAETWLQRRAARDHDLDGQLTARSDRGRGRGARGSRERDRYG